MASPGKAALKMEFKNRIAVLKAISPNTAATYRAGVNGFVDALPAT